jgi:cellulose biosynthesis protein BcsQ
MKIITVANPVGGTAKTTTAHAIAVTAAEYGRNVLLVDADPKASLTSNLGIENPRATILEIVSKTVSIDLATIRTTERFDLLAGAVRCANTNKDLSADLFNLKANQYDLVIFDTPSNFTSSYEKLVQIADLLIAPCDGSINSARGVQLLADFQSKAKTSIIKILKLNWNESELGSAYLDRLYEDYSHFETAITIASPQDFAMASIKHQHAITLNKSSKLGSEYRELTYFLLADLFGRETNFSL